MIELADQLLIKALLGRDRTWAPGRNRDQDKIVIARPARVKRQVGDDFIQLGEAQAIVQRTPEMKRQ